MTAPYVELRARTNYSLLEGASHPEELVGRAAELGYHALAVTDRDNLYGAMVFARRCHEAGIRPIVGAEVTVAADPDDPDSPRHPLTLLAASRQGYANLSRLLSAAYGYDLPTQAGRDRRRLAPCLARPRLAAHTDGLLCLTGGRHGEVVLQLD